MGKFFVCLMKDNQELSYKYKLDNRYNLTRFFISSNKTSVNAGCPTFEEILCKCIVEFSCFKLCNNFFKCFGYLTLHIEINGSSLDSPQSSTFKILNTIIKINDGFICRGRYIKSSAVVIKNKCVRQIQTFFEILLQNL